MLERTTIMVDKKANTVTVTGKVFDRRVTIAFETEEKMLHFIYHDFLPSEFVHYTVDKQLTDKAEKYLNK